MYWFEIGLFLIIIEQPKAAYRTQGCSTEISQSEISYSEISSFQLLFGLWTTRNFAAEEHSSAEKSYSPENRAALLQNLLHSHLTTVLKIMLSRNIGTRTPFLIQKGKGILLNLSNQYTNSAENVQSQELAYG